MIDAITFLNAGLALGFLSLGILAAVQWRRRGDPPSPFIALALGSLGVVILLGVIENGAGARFLFTLRRP